MNGHNPSSTTVLTGHATLGGVALTEEAGATQGDTPGRGSAPPPPPPPPPTQRDGNKAERQRMEQEAKELNRRLKQSKRQDRVDKLRRIDRSYYIAGAGIGVCIVGFLGLKSVLSTMLSIAEANNGNDAPTAVAEPQQVVVQGIENPLEQLPLTQQARWMIGLTSDGKLVPNRSTQTMAELLAQADLCGVYVRLADDASIELLDSPAGGAVPFAECAATPTTVQVPSDPTPSSVPGA